MIQTPQFKRDNFLTVPRWTIDCVICKFDDTVVWFFFPVNVSTFISVEGEQDS